MLPKLPSFPPMGNWIKPCSWFSSLLPAKFFLFNFHFNIACSDIDSFSSKLQSCTVLCQNSDGHWLLGNEWMPDSDHCTCGPGRIPCYIYGWKDRNRSRQSGGPDFFLVKRRTQLEGNLLWWTSWWRRESQPEQTISYSTSKTEQNWSRVTWLHLRVDVYNYKLHKKENQEDPLPAVSCRNAILSFRRLKIAFLHETAGSGSSLDSFLWSLSHASLLELSTLFEQRPPPQALLGVAMFLTIIIIQRKHSQTPASLFLAWRFDLYPKVFLKGSFEEDLGRKVETSGQKQTCWCRWVLSLKVSPSMMPFK